VVRAPWINVMFDIMALGANRVAKLTLTTVSRNQIRRSTRRSTDQLLEIPSTMDDSTFVNCVWELPELAAALPCRPSEPSRLPQYARFQRPTLSRNISSLILEHQLCRS